MTDEQTAALLRGLALLGNILCNPRDDVKAEAASLLWNLAYEWEDKCGQP